MILFTIFCITLVVGCGKQKALIHPSPPIVEEDPIIVEDPITEENDTETFEYSFPDVVELNFKPVDLEELEKGKPQDSWEFIQSIPFGEMQKKEVALHIYQVTDTDHICSSRGNIGLLEYSGETYMIGHCISDSLLSENLWEYQSAYILPHTFVSEEGQTILHATIELFANGPGQMLYIFYDTKNGRWLTFWDWGYPFLVDLDSSGDIVLVNPFAGLHMHWPDATIYRWNNGVLESSYNLKSVLGIDDQNWNEVSLQEKDNAAIFDVIAILDQQSQQVKNAVYRYENGKLHKIE